MNFSFFATKSVSEFTSTATPTPSKLPAQAMPSAAILPAFFWEAARPFSLRYSTALSISPSDSTRAFLQSIMPTPVISRSFLTSAAVKAISISSCKDYLLLLENREQKDAPWINSKIRISFPLLLLPFQQQLLQLPLRHPVPDGLPERHLPWWRRSGGLRGLRRRLRG